MRIPVLSQRRSLPLSAAVAIGAAAALVFGPVNPIGAIRDGGESCSAVTPNYRALDTRAGAGTKLGPTSTLDVKVAGVTGVPATAKTVKVQITTTGLTVPGSFLVAYPKGTTRPPSSNINPTSDHDSSNGAVPVAVGSDESITVYNEQGSTHVIIDVLEWCDEHNHDDDYYKKTEVDDGFIPHGEIVLTHGVQTFTDWDPILSTGLGGDPIFSAPTSAIHAPLPSVSRAIAVGLTPDETVSLPIDGPAKLGAVEYGLKSIEYCIAVMPDTFVTTARVTGVTSDTTDPTGYTTLTASDATDRMTSGCFTIPVDDPDSTSFVASWVLDFGAVFGWVDFVSVQSTWAPKSTLDASAVPKTVGSGASGTPEIDISTLPIPSTASGS